MYVVRMRGIIKAHGHLVLEGDETKPELMEALRNLRQHTYTTCHRPGLGTPIESLLPDINELEERFTRSPKNVRNVDMSSGKL
jgi:hypothetical protein